jgi:hypothetical protein
MTKDPRTMRKMNGAERVNGLDGSEVAAAAEEEVAAADEVEDDETEADEEEEGAEEDVRIFGIVLVGFVDMGWLLSLGAGVGDESSVGVA